MRNSDFEKWSPSDVSDQLNEIGLGSYAQEFVKNDIFGEILPMLEEKHLRSMGMKTIGHRIAFLRFVKTLTSAKEAKTEAPSRPIPQKQTPNLTSSFSRREQIKPKVESSDDEENSDDEIGNDESLKVNQKKTTFGQRVGFNRNEEYSKPTPQQTTRRQPFTSARKAPAPVYQEPSDDSDEDSNDDDDNRDSYRYIAQKKSPFESKRTTPMARKPTYNQQHSNNDDSDDEDNSYSNKRITPSRKPPTPMYGGMGIDEDDEDAVFNRKPAVKPSFQQSRQSADRYQPQPQSRPLSRQKPAFDNAYGNDSDSDDQDDNDNYYNRQMQARKSQNGMKPYGQQARNSYYDENNDDDNDDDYRMKNDRPKFNQPPKESGPPPYEEFENGDVESSLATCRYCGRHFGQDRIEQHEKICSKVKKTKKRVFDSSKMRVQGTEAAAYLGKSTAPDPPKKKSAVPKYKLEHDQLVASIRAGRMQAQYEKDLAAGKNVAPPELPKYEIVNDTRVECPVCHRKFSEEALQRHLPSCERSHARAGRR